jgi:hypothetical protein
LDAWPRAGVGAAAGVAGTVLVQRTIKAGGRWLPATRAPIRRDPGAYAVERMEQRLPDGLRRRIPERARALGAEAAHFVYGSTAGATYALLRPRGGRPVRDGVLLGLGVWAAGYLGWLPRAGLLPPMREHTLPQLAGEIGQMALFGMATAATFTAVERLAERWFLPRVVARGRVRAKQR